jgi:hypothetical protein
LNSEHYQKIPKKVFTEKCLKAYQEKPKGGWPSFGAQVQDKLRPSLSILPPADEDKFSTKTLRSSLRDHNAKPSPKDPKSVIFSTDDKKKDAGLFDELTNLPYKKSTTKGNLAAEIDALPRARPTVATKKGGLIREETVSHLIQKNNSFYKQYLGKEHPTHKLMLQIKKSLHTLKLDTDRLDSYFESKGIKSD